MSDEFPADDFGVYAPGLRVTKLGPDGEQLFSVEQGKITFHKSGVYEINVPATVRWLADELDQDDRDFLTGASAAPSELARVLTEVCRALPWNVRAQEELVGEVVAALPEYFPDGVLMIPGELVDRGTRGDHMRVVVPDSPDEDEPWSLRQWALLARQTMEQQALQLGEIKSGHGVTWGMVDRTVAHANKMLREVVAEYPEDLDAVQAEQAIRNADDEAVRRLAHAMTEVANQLDSPALGVIPNVRLDSEKLIHLVRKLRGTVDTWTTEEQRRPWAQAMSGGQDAAAEPVNEEAPADHPAWWVAHAGCRHSVDSHRGQQAGGGCRATGCDCKATSDGLRRRCDPVEPDAAQAPRGDEGAHWAPGVVFRDVMEALHQAEWLTRHLRGSVPSDYIGPNNELNRLVRGLLGLEG